MYYNKYYRKININNYLILIHKNILEDNSNIINYFNNPIKLFDYQLISFKNSKRTKAGCIKLGNKFYFFKSYNNRGLIYTAKTIVRKSRPFKVLNTSIKLNNLNINTPTVLAAIEKRIFNMIIESYILTDFIDGYKLEYLLNKSHTNQHVILGYISNFISQIHNKNIFHGDLKANNLLIDKTNKSKIWLLDLDSVKIKSYISLKERIKDIARFIVSIDQVISEKLLLFFVDSYIKKVNVIKKELFIKELNSQILEIKKRHEQKTKYNR